MSKVEFVVQQLHVAAIWKLNNLEELCSMLRLLLGFPGLSGDARCALASTFTIHGARHSFSGGGLLNPGGPGTELAPSIFNVDFIVRKFGSEVGAAWILYDFECRISQ